MCTNISNFQPKEPKITLDFKCVKNSRALPIYDHKKVISWGKAKERLILTLLTSSRYHIAIQTLSEKEQARLNKTGNVGFFKKYFWKPLTLINQDGTQTTILVNINSAVRRLTSIGLSSKEVIASLDDGTLLDKIMQKLPEQEPALSSSLVQHGVNNKIKVGEPVESAKPIDDELLTSEAKDRALFHQALKKLRLTSYVQVAQFKEIQKIKKDKGYPSFEMALLMRDLRDFDGREAGTAHSLIVPTTGLIKLSNQICEQADDLEEIESAWSRCHPGRNLEEELKKPVNQSITRFTTIKEPRFELAKLHSIHREKNKEIQFLQEVRAHPEQMENDPFIAMRVHHILHKFARDAILDGRIEEAFEINANIAQTLPFSSNHPLYEMDEAILTGSSKQFDSKSGAYFSGFDIAILKNGHLHASHRVIDGKKYNCFDFKITHYARDDLTGYLKSIKANEEMFKASLPEDLRKDFKMTNNCEQKFHRFDEKTQQFTLTESYCPAFSRGTELSFGANGKVIIGNSPEVGCMYNKIMVQIPAHCPTGEGLHHLHQILAVSGIGPILAKQSADADERMKIKQLLRAFYPRLATKLEKQEQFYTDPLDLIKGNIVAKEPGMEGVFRKYLDISPELMQKIEIAPGKEMWGVTDLGEQMRAQGAWGLMTGIGASGVWENTKVSIERMLTEGALSSEQRFHKGVFKKGASSNADLVSGGGDQVFTRLVNQNLQNEPIQSFPLIDQAQILWDLDSVAARVPYGFGSDNYGVKNPTDSRYWQYQNRVDLIFSSHANQGVSNEVMIKNAIDPSHMIGIVVGKKEQKEDLAAHLLQKGLASQDQNGAIYITVKEKKMAIDDFIYVGDRNQPFQKLWWKTRA
ncbi:MAG: hypothetical protein ACH350_06275 [Parachlamydiaceae bacterium]